MATKPKVQDVILIEQSLAGRLDEAVSPAIAELWSDLSPLLDAEKYPEALNRVYEFDITEQVKSIEGYIWFSTLAALHFGAAQCSGDAGNPSLPARVYQEVLPIIRTNLISTYAGKIKEALVARIQLFVQQAKEDSGDAPVSIFKADRVVRDFVSFRRDADDKAKLISQLHTSRLSAYGYTAQAEVLGVTRYAVNEQLDNRACPVCREMHGKTFEVASARQALDVILYVQNPDELKSLQPWPSQSKQSVEAMSKMSEAELVQKNWHIPPYHPGCRGLLVNVGDAPDLGAIAEDWKYTADADDFSEIQLSMTAEQVAVWNDLLAAHPLDIISAFTGTAPLQILDILKGTTIKDAVGLEALVIGENSVQLSLKGQYGGDGVSTISATLTKGKAQITELDIADPDSMQTVLDAMVTKLAPLGVKTLEMAIPKALSYEWAMLGFVPAASDWALMSVVVLKRLTYFRGKIPDEVYSKLLGIVQSPKPDTLTFLADLTLTVDGQPLASLLLKDLAWQGQLDVSDSLTVAKVTTMIGTSKE